jgi:hypothetical protein
MKHFSRFLALGALALAAFTAHAGTISSLPAASTLDGTEVAPVDQGATTKKALVSDISDYIKTIIKPTGGNGTIQWQFGSGNSATFSGDPEFLWDFSNNIMTVGSTSTAGVVRGGTGVPSSNGAPLTVQGGPAGSTNTGGPVIVKGGDGGGTSGNGGTAQVIGGTPVDGNGGATSVNGGNAVGTNRGGGAVTVAAGSSTGTATGGSVSVTGGFNSGTGIGGAINITGGPSTSGKGGGVTIIGGIAGTAGAGGDVALNGRSGVGTAANGGWVTLTPGSASDSGGQSGTIEFAGWQADTSFDFMVPTTGFSLTLTDKKTITILDPAGTLATGTVTMPAKPNNGQLIRVASSQTITSLTVSPNTSQSIKNAPTTLAAGTEFAYIYRQANTTWYRLQ